MADTNGNPKLLTEAQALEQAVTQGILGIRSSLPRFRAALIQRLLETFCPRCGYELRDYEPEGCPCSRRVS